MAIISGPEPQRSLFEKKIFEVASKINDEFLIVRGFPGEIKNTFHRSNCKVFNHLNTNDMEEAIGYSEFVISPLRIYHGYGDPIASKKIHPNSHTRAK
jgi:hypothetical protein